MEIRKLKSTDLFSICQIVKKIGVDEVKDCFTKPEIMNLLKEDGGKGQNAEKIGLAITFDIVSLVIGNLPKAQDEIYRFLADLTGLEKKEVEDLPMDQFAELVIEVVQRDEFRDFSQVASKLFK